MHTGGYNKSYVKDITKALNNDRPIKNNLLLNKNNKYSFIRHHSDCY